MLTTAQIAKPGAAALGGFTGHPATFSKVRGSVGVSVCSKATLPTAESVLTGPVRLLDMSADGALTRGVAWIYGDQRNTSKNCLVRQEQPELRECPGVQNCLLFTMPNRDAVANAAKFFDGNSATAAFSRGNDLLGNNVICMRGKALLFARKFLQAALGRAGLFLLQLSPQAAMAKAHGFSGAAAVPIAIGVGGDVRDSKIDSKELINVSDLWSVDVTSRGQIELTAVVDQIRLALLRLQEFALSFSQRVLHLQAAIDAQDADGRFSGEPQDPVIVSDGSVGPKGPLGTLVELISIGHFSSGSDDHLTGQKRECGAGVVVAEFVDGKLPEDLGIPRVIRDPIATGIDRFHRVLEGVGLFWRRQQLHFGGQLHNFSISRIEGGGASSPCLKAGVSAPEI